VVYHKADNENTQCDPQGVVNIGARCCVIDKRSIATIINHMKQGIPRKHPKLALRNSICQEEFAAKHHIDPLKRLGNDFHHFWEKDGQ
jgi:hypothetical protein